jgi:hypothetical protein
MERLPESIEVGMRVFDSERHEIGKVDSFKYPENATDPDATIATTRGMHNRDDTTIIQTLAEAFGEDELPQPLRNQLLRDGYVHLDAHGWFARDRYILPEQIARLDTDGIQLNVTRDALIKRPH